jgi:hypothetical protein
MSVPGRRAVRTGGDGTVTAPTTPAPSGRWTNRRALVLHGILLVWIPGCAAACWWQVTVALSGDKLGWVYTFMWPAFAVFGTVLWWNLIHDDPDTVGARGLRRLRREASSAAEPSGPAVSLDDTIDRAEQDDAELAAYNAYLAELGRAAPTKTWRRR